MKRNNLLTPLLLTFLLSNQLSAFSGANIPSSSGGNISNFGGGFNINGLMNGIGSINMESFGLQGITANDIFNMDLNVLSGSVSVKCDIPKIPPVPSDFCASVNDLEVPKLMKSFDIGICTVDANANSDFLENTLDMAKEICDRVRNKANQYGRAINDTLAKYETYDMKIGVKASDANYGSAYSSNENNTLKIIDKKMPNGKSMSDIYNPKNGVLGFDKLYKSDKNYIPNELTTAYFNDDYEEYRIYEKFAKTSSEIDSNNNADFSKITFLLPETHLDYIQEIQANTIKLVDEAPTIYVIEKKLSREISRLEKDNPVNLNSGMSSAEMKQEYLKVKAKIQDELLNINDINEEDNYTELAKALRDIEDHSLGKFQEEEEAFRIESNYLVDPSQLKAKTLPAESRKDYIKKALRQRDAEIRRKADEMIRIKNKQELIKLLAQKTFIGSLEYRPEIAQKEIDEILSN